MKKLTRLLIGVLLGAVAVCSVAMLSACGDEHAHTWDTEYTIDTPADCTHNGSKSKHCTHEDCDAKTDVQPILAGHEWEETPTVDQEANCYQAGSKSLHCKNCEETKEPETIPATGNHVWAEEYTIDEPADCTNNGSKSHHCKTPGCSATDTPEVIPAGHEWEETPTVDQEVTCEENGLQSIHCKNCEATKDSKPIIATGTHEWDEGFTVDEEATSCDHPGSKSIHCKKCTATKETTPITIAHVKVDHLQTASTCTVKGHSTYYSCENCSLLFSDEACTQVITMADVEEYDLAVHVFDMWNASVNQEAATCTTDGHKTYYRCENCDGKFASTTPTGSPISAEDWESNYVLKATHKTVQTRTQKDATCKQIGYSTTHYYCTGCKGYALDKAFTQPITAAEAKAFEIAKLEDIWSSEWTVDKVATCSVKGSRSHHCTRTGCDKKTDIEDIPQLDHTWKEDKDVDVAATCQTEGSKSIHCSVCSASKDGTSEVIPVSATAHVWSARKFINTPATCTTAGTQFQFCTVCEAHGADEVLAANPTLHSYSPLWTVDKAATCTTAGSQSRHCTYCGDKGYATEIPALGHRYEWTFDGLNGTATCSNGCNGTKNYTLPEVVSGKTVNSVTEVNVAGSHNVYMGANLAYVTITASYSLAFTAPKSGVYLFEYDHVSNVITSVQGVTVGGTSIKGSRATVTSTGSGRSAKVNSIEATLYKGETVTISGGTQSGGGAYYIVNVSLKQESTNVLTEGANPVKVTVSGDLTGVDSYTFMPTETKTYSITVPEGLSVTMNNNDLISDGTYKNFSATKNTSITFSFIHTTTGDYEVIIGAAYPQTLELGTKLSVDLEGKTMLGYTVPDNLAPGRYTLTFSGSFLTMRKTGCGHIWVQVNGQNDYASMSEATAVHVQAGGSTSLPGYSLNTASTSRWVLTLELGAGDVVYFAPESSILEGSTVGTAVEITLTKA